MSEIKSALCIIGAGIFWGIISIFVNMLKELGFDSLQCVAIRVFFAALFLILYLWFKDREKLKIDIKDVKYFLGTGILSIVFFNYCYFEAIEVIGGAAVPALLLYMAPVFVMILSFFLFHEKITVQKVVALCMTIVGLGFVTGAFTGAEQISGKAVLLGLGAGLGYALYSIFGKMIVEKYSAVTITTYTFFIASVASVPLSGVLPKAGALVCPKGVLAVCGLSLISTVLAFSLYTMGLKQIEAGKAAILATIEPFVAAIVGAVFYREQFDLPKILGMVCIICSIVILNLKFKKQGSDDNGQKCGAGSE